MALYSVDYKSLGKKIKELRLQHELTQEKLAEKAGISVNYVSNIETANSKFSMNVLLSIVNVFEIGIDALFSDQLVYCRNIQKEENELIPLITKDLLSFTDVELKYINKTIMLIKDLKEQLHNTD